MACRARIWRRIRRLHHLTGTNRRRAPELIPTVMRALGVRDADRGSASASGSASGDLRGREQLIVVVDDDTLYPPRLVEVRHDTSWCVMVDNNTPYPPRLIEAPPQYAVTRSDARHERPRDAP